MQKNYGGLFDQDKKQQKIEELTNMMSEEGFWNREDSSDIIGEINSFKEDINKIKKLK